MLHFVYQLTHGETPEIHVDGDLKLIYINELAEEFYKQIVKTNVTGINKYLVPHTSESKVSEILDLLKQFKQQYLEKGIMPDITQSFVLEFV